MPVLQRPPIVPWLTALLLLPAAAAGQAPGYSGPDARQLRAEFRAEMLGQVHEVLGHWGTVWSRDELEELADMYAEDAVVFPPRGDPVRGREAIRSWLASVLPDHHGADAFLQDFAASGQMAAVQTTYRIALGNGTGRELTGVMFIVFLQQGRTWRIRSQVFRPSEDPEGGA